MFEFSSRNDIPYYASQYGEKHKHPHNVYLLTSMDTPRTPREWNTPKTRNKYLTSRWRVERTYVLECKFYARDVYGRYLDEHIWQGTELQLQPAFGYWSRHTAKRFRNAGKQFKFDINGHSIDVRTCRITPGIGSLGDLSLVFRIDGNEPKSYGWNPLRTIVDEQRGHEENDVDRIYTAIVDELDRLMPVYADGYYQKEIKQAGQYIDSETLFAMFGECMRAGGYIDSLGPLGWDPANR